MKFIICMFLVLSLAIPAQAAKELAHFNVIVHFVDKDGKVTGQQKVTATKKALSLLTVEQKQAVKDAALAVKAVVELDAQQAEIAKLKELAEKYPTEIKK